MKTVIILVAIFNLLTGCSLTQLPKREIVQVDKNNLQRGSGYKARDTTIAKDGVPSKFRQYFNDLDFEGIASDGRVIIDSPYTREKDWSKIPEDKFGLYHQLRIDSFMSLSLSKLLFKAEEPILSAYYTGNETYRFLWSRSFDDDYVIRLIRQNNQSIIHTTKLGRKTGKIEKSEKRISNKSFANFRELLRKGNFWAMPSYKDVTAFDGSQWVIEAHMPIGYKILYRHSPGLVYEDDLILRQAGQWLIDKSCIKTDKIY